MNKNLLKAVLIFGGGYALFSLLKTSKNLKETKSFSTKEESQTPTPSPENVQIVFTAYSDALAAGESPSRLSELNKECMKEFGMRCYVNDGKVVVCDVKGNPISV